jgi:zinc protease
VNRPVSPRPFAAACAALALGLACGGTPPAPAQNPGAVATAPPRPVEPEVEAFRAERPAPTAPGRFEFPTPQLVTLDNGLSVYWVRRPTRVLTLSLIVRHGASSVPAGKSGLAGLTARMLTEGTRKKPAVMLAEAVESLGTTLAAGASRDESSLGLTVRCSRRS